MKKKRSKLVASAYADGGPINSQNDVSSPNPFMQVGVAALNAVPSQSPGMNNLGFTKAGASAGAMFGPWGAAIGGAAGLGADLFMGPRNMDQAYDARQKMGQGRASQLEENSIYNNGGFNQVNNGWMQPGGYAFGGPIGGGDENPPVKTQPDPLLSEARMKELSRLEKQLQANRTYQDPLNRELFMEGILEAPGKPYRLETEADRLGAKTSIPHPRGYSGRVGELIKTRIPLGDRQVWDIPHRSVMERRAQGGPVGHVIPVENVPQAKQDARRAGKTALLGKADMTGENQGGIVPGKGSSKADDKTMRPAGGPAIKISSGEMYVEDGNFEAMANAAGMSKEEYAAMMYPNAMGEPFVSRSSAGSLDRKRMYAYGGQVDQGLSDQEFGMMNDRLGNERGLLAPGVVGQPVLGPQGAQPVPGIPPQTGPWPGTGGTQVAPYNAMNDLGVSDQQIPRVTASTPGKPVTQPMVGEDATMMQPRSANQMLAGAGGGQSSVQQPQQGVMTPAGTAGPVDEPGFSAIDYDDLMEQNRIASTVQGALTLGSLVYNAFSRRSAATRPEEYVPERLDLQTGALKTKLDSDRQRGTATALYNTRGSQNIGRNLGILANDLQARTGNTMQVENVENQERVANNQLTNRAKLYNNDQLTRYKMSEEASENAFRERKGQAIGQNLSGLAGISAGYLNNQNMLFLAKDRNQYNADMLKWLEGHPEFANVWLNQLLRTE